jgi:hypothetical protein
MKSSPSYCWRTEKRGFVRFVHLFRNCVPSLKKSLGMSRNSWIWSDIVATVRCVFGRDVQLGLVSYGKSECLGSAKEGGQRREECGGGSEETVVWRKCGELSKLKGGGRQGQISRSREDKVWLGR